MRSSSVKGHNTLKIPGSDCTRMVPNPASSRFCSQRYNSQCRRREDATFEQHHVCPRRDIPHRASVTSRLVPLATRPLPCATQGQPSCAALTRRGAAGFFRGSGRGRRARQQTDAVSCHETSCPRRHHIVRAAGRRPRGQLDGFDAGAWHVRLVPCRWRARRRWLRPRWERVRRRGAGGSWMLCS